MVHALGIAGTQASWLMAAQSGLYGALLAEAGFTGITDVFESPYGGFCTTFSRSTDRFDLVRLTAELGERWETLHVSLKLYASVGTTHSTLDALRRMRARRAFAPEEVASIAVEASRGTVEHCGWPYKPAGMTAAQLNLAFVLRGDAAAGGRGLRGRVHGSGAGRPAALGADGEGERDGGA